MTEREFDRTIKAARILKLLGLAALIYGVWLMFVPGPNSWALWIGGGLLLRWAGGGLIQYAEIADMAEWTRRK